MNTLTATRELTSHIKKYRKDLVPIDDINFTAEEGA